MLFEMVLPKTLCKEALPRIKSKAKMHVSWKVFLLFSFPNNISQISFILYDNQIGRCGLFKMNKKVAALKLRDHKLAVSSKDTVLVVTEAFEK